MGVAVSNSNAARVACASDETVPQSVPVDFGISAKCWSEWQDLNLRPPRPERGALPATAHLLSSPLSADNFRLMTLGRRGPRQSDPWSASPSDNLPFCWSWSDRDQHVISLILASTVIVISGHMGVQL